jgi:hypothetical protein
VAHKVFKDRKDRREILVDTTPQEPLRLIREIIPFLESLIVNLTVLYRRHKQLHFKSRMESRVRRERKAILVLALLYWVDLALKRSYCPHN